MISMQVNPLVVCLSIAAFILMQLSALPALYHKFLQTAYTFVQSFPIDDLSLANSSFLVS